MNRTVLIDAILRQVMELVADIAIAEGKRAPLADISSNAYLELCRALSARGLSSKVIADMFGITVRAHNQKKKRLAGGLRDMQKTLWQRIATKLQQKGSLTKNAIFAAFPSTEGDVISGILFDLVESGLVSKDGKGLETRYQWESGNTTNDESGQDHLASFVWVVVHRLGPIRRSALAIALPSVALGDIERSVQLLHDEGRIQIDSSGQNAEPTYSSHQCILEKGEASGWEAPAYDHFQAVMTVLKNRLNKDRVPPNLQSHTGGSTYYFDIQDQHPFRDDVVSLLTKIREEVSSLRSTVDEYNAKHTNLLAKKVGVSGKLRSVFYIGQSIERDE